MSEVRDGGVNVGDRTRVVGQARGDARRAESRASRAASAAAYAEDEALVASDQALLAQATADDAMFEAEFGSIAVGRLLAGSLEVDTFIESTSYSAPSGSSAGSGWRISADGNAVFNNVSVYGALYGSATLGSLQASSRADLLGGVNLGIESIIWDNGACSIWFDSPSATGGVIHMHTEGFGAYVDGSPVATTANHGHNTGTRTTNADSVDWGSSSNNGYSGYTNENGTNADLTDGTFHRHVVPTHTHTLTI